MQAVIIDDKNSRVNYTSGWYNADGHSTDFNQTTTVSGVPNSGFHFTFNGTSVAVFGSIPANNTALSTYTIDTASPATFVYPNLTQYTSGQLLYQSPQLQDGLHTLAVNVPDTVIGVASTQFVFDYLSYVPSPSSNSSTDPGTAPGSQASSSRSSNINVVLPAVLVPCLLCIALLAVALYVQGRRMKHAYARSSADMEKLASSTKIDSAAIPMFPSAPRAPPPESELGTYDYGDNMSFQPSPLPRSSFTSCMASPAATSTLARAPSSLLPTRSVTPDPMLEITRARRLKRFKAGNAPSAFRNGPPSASVFSMETVDTADVPPTYRSASSVDGR